MNESERSRPHFYFSLLRLMATLRGADARRAENNEAEAWVAGVAIYVINYLFFAQLFPADLIFWQKAVLLVLLAFLIVPFWLLVLYFNSLVIKFLRLCGLFWTIPIRRAQSILLGTWATAMALDLARRGSWIGEIAAIWLVAVAMNLAASAVLVFRDGTGRHE